MRRKKIENALFGFLMWLPIIIIGVYSACLIFACNQNDNPISIISFETYFMEISLFLVGGDLEFVPPVVSEAVMYFTNIIGIPSVYGLMISILFIYWVGVELVHLLYDLVIFIPRACRSIVEKGM